MVVVMRVVVASQNDNGVLTKEFLGSLGVCYSLASKASHLDSLAMRCLGEWSEVKWNGGRGKCMVWVSYVHLVGTPSTQVDGKLVVLWGWKLMILALSLIWELREMLIS